MICVTCRHFEYLIRYEKWATCGGSMRKVMTSSNSARQGLSNGMIHVPSFFNIWWDTKKSAKSGGSMWKVMTSSDSSLRGLSNDMRHVPLFWISNQIRKIGNIRRFDVESDYVIKLISVRAFEWYASRAAILNI